MVTGLKLAENSMGWLEISLIPGSEGKPYITKNRSRRSKTRPVVLENILVGAILELGRKPQSLLSIVEPWLRGAACDGGTASLSVTGEIALGVRTDSVLAVDEGASPPVSRRCSSS